MYSQFMMHGQKNIKQKQRPAITTWKVTSILICSNFSVLTRPKNIKITKNIDF